MAGELRENGKRTPKFKIFAVLVDVGSSELSTLAQFSDHVSSVKKLTVEGFARHFSQDLGLDLFASGAG